MVACCRCNKTGRCGNCACVRAGKNCQDCLPSRLGLCRDTLAGKSTTTTKTINSSQAVTVSTAATPTTSTSEAVSLTATTITLSPSQAVSATASITTAAIPTYQLPATSSNQTTHQLMGHQLTSDNLKFVWGTTDAITLTRQLSGAYREVVQWKRNIFKIPQGNAGKAFVSELAHLYNAYGVASALEHVALQATIVMPHLLLQKPHKGSKNKHHLECLKRRFDLWKEGKIEEGRAIQSRLLHTTRKHMKEDVARSFANLMFEGKTKQALQLLSDRGRGSVLQLNQTFDVSGSSTTVRDVLRSKHPPSQDSSPDTLLQGVPPDIHPVIFDQIDGSLMRSTSLHISSAVGPSGLDSHNWKRLCTSFKSASADLCQSLALLAKRLCTTSVPPNTLAPLLACRLVALDKCPGVRPIGIGDTVRRLITKAVLSVIKEDILDVASGFVLDRNPVVRLRYMLFVSYSNKKGLRLFS